MADINQTIMQVSLLHRSYPIYLGSGLLAHQALFEKYIHGHQVLIVTQEKVAAFCLESLLQSLQPYHVAVCYLPDGEQYKTVEHWQKIIDQLIHEKHERSTTLIALGGGVVGDMTGFAAACYLRGVNYMHVPTTLMAQVDSAIGGKTGLNHPLGKNLIGAFYQPICVIADFATLTTLPQREFIAGMAEVVKYALIQDASFFQWLEENAEVVLQRDASAVAYMVHQCAAIKASIIMQDERDQNVRQLLNFGHTVGHALEAAFDYHTLVHGEAVAVGMIVAAELSHALGWIELTQVNRIRGLIQRIGLPITIPSSLSNEVVMQLLRRDKKIQNNKINFVLLESVGRAVMTSNVSDEQLCGVLNRLRPAVCPRDRGQQTNY